MDKPDIVERLEANAEDYTGDLQCEAAAEITRLRAQLAAAREGLDRIESQALCAGMPAEEPEIRSWLVNIASISDTTLAALKETDNG